MLMPSTPFASPQVVSRHFTLFRVPGIGVSAGQQDFYSGFDSRQLHRKEAGQDHQILTCFLCASTFHLSSAPIWIPLTILIIGISFIPSGTGFGCQCWCSSTLCPEPTGSILRHPHLRPRSLMAASRARELQR
jgi:hypothetical protein